jgi:hypothetical protein
LNQILVKTITDDLKLFKVGKYSCQLKIGSGHVISLTYAIAGAPYKTKQTQDVKPTTPLSCRRERVGVRVV